jgi:hypothetical protein
MPVDQKVPLQNQPLSPSEIGKIVPVEPAKANEPPAPANAATPAASTPPAATKTDPPADKKWAGKYASPEELAKGLRNIWKHAGLGELPEGELWGDAPTSRWKSVEDAEASYANAERLTRQTKAADRTPTILDDPSDALPSNQKQDGFQNIPISEWIKNSGLTQAELEKAYAEGRYDEAMREQLRRSHPSYSQMPKQQAYDVMDAKLQLAMMQLNDVRTKAVEIAGGKDFLRSMLSAIDTVVPADERAALRAIIDNPATSLVGLRSLKSHYEAATANGKGDAPVAGTPAPSGVTEAEYAQAQMDFRKYVNAQDSQQFKRAVDIINRAPESIWKKNTTVRRIG